MYHVLEQEEQFRKEKGLKAGYESLRTSKPILSVGAKEPLEDQLLIADYYRTFSNPIPTRTYLLSLLTDLE